MTVSFPKVNRNYCVFDEEKISEKLALKEKAIPIIEYELNNNHSESSVVENLYLLNRMLDDGVDKNKISKIYPALSIYNNSSSPNIQTYLAGIYRKTKIPDAFGPLVKMLIQDSITPPESANFDPTEEIGGAILNYLV